MTNTEHNNTNSKEITTMSTTAITDQRVSTEPHPTGQVLPCLWCGVATRQTGNRWHATEVEVTQSAPPITPPGWSPARWKVPMTTCSDCAHLDVRARVIVAMHPRLSARLGDGQALDAAAGVVSGLHLISRPLPDPDLPDADLAALIRALANLGLRQRWRALITADTLEQVSAEPWSEVTTRARADLRTAYASLLAEKHAAGQPPVRLGPPPITPETLHSTSTVVPVADGCIFCGVGSVEVPAVEVQRAGSREKAAHNVWRQVERTTTTNLGARPGPHYVTGWLCETCAPFAESEGGPTLTAAERAVVAHLGLGGRWIAGDRALSGFRTYGALVSDARRPDAWLTAPPPPPPGFAWDHLGDLDVLRADLARSMGVPDPGPRRGA